MRKLLVLVTATCLPCLGLSAQEGPPQPAKELAKLERLIGNWVGSGTAVMAPGAPEMPWTATSTFKKAMGGHCLLEETLIDIGPEAPAPIVFKSYYGFDRENNRYVVCGISNMGPGAATELHLVDDDTLVTVESRLEEGKLVVDRWVTKLGKESYSFIGHRAIADGEFFVHVKGSMKRAKTAPRGIALNATASLRPVPAEMQKLSPLDGTYKFEGEMSMAPGQPAIKISGIETLEPVLGGNVLEMHVTGDPIPGMGKYESWAALVWNPQKGSYTNLYVNNMGQIGSNEGRWVGKDLVFTHSMLQKGQPTVGRVILRLDEKGGISSVSAHSIVAGGDPFIGFKGTYTKQ